MNNSILTSENETDLPIDWLDIKVAIIIGLVSAPLKACELLGHPSWAIPGKTIEIISSTLCVAYILWRTERPPETSKLFQLPCQLKNFVGLNARHLWPLC